MNSIKIFTHLFILILLFYTISSNAWDISLTPMKQGYKGWLISANITLYNNMSEPAKFKIYAVNPNAHTRYNDSGIYDTITNGSDLKEYEDFPNLSWIITPKEVIVPAKNGTDISKLTVPIIVNIPPYCKYRDKRYEALICAEMINKDRNIQISLASRLLITTPHSCSGKLNNKTVNAGNILMISVAFIIAIIIIKRRQ